MRLRRIIACLLPSPLVSREAARIKSHARRPRPRSEPLLETEPALEPGTGNELTPRALPISAAAAGIMREFYDHIESQCGSGNSLASIGDFAAKAAEHAARIAGVITIVEDLHAKEIGLEAMQGAIDLVDWYVREADRLKAAGRTDPKLLRAAKLLEWLQGMLQFGLFAPRRRRNKLST
jgi:uncharacterized protein DUF3987